MLPRRGEGADRVEAPNFDTGAPAPFLGGAVPFGARASGSRRDVSQRYSPVRELVLGLLRAATNPRTLVASMSEQGSRRDELGSTGAGAALSVFLGGLAAAAGYPLGAVAGASALGQILGVLGYDNLARRSESFLSTFRRILHESHEGDFDREIRDRAKDPEFRNVMFHAFRQLRDALDDSVAPALAVLAKDYSVPSTRRIDPFFRGMGDLLRDLSATEYADLVTFIVDVASLVADPDEQHYVGVIQGRQGEVAAAVMKPFAPYPRVAKNLTAATHGRRVIAMMLKHGLAENVPGGPAAISHGDPPHTVSFDVMGSFEPETLKRILSVVTRATA
jgi:hypothetical protein